ncbi:MFS transporter [Paraburkholderia sp. EG286B]|uniref:MFS transporter n=1 Tax=Paraburkholderia sp. EG286B TaxID=3237011 RepID=UPI0034D16201
MATVDAKSMLDRVCRKVSVRIMPMFFMSFIVAYLDRINISFAKLQMAADTGLTDATYAIGASIFFASYMVFEVPSNLILRRVGTRLWLARIMITWGVVSMAMMFVAPIAASMHVTQTQVFYMLRFLLGICEAGFMPGVLFYIGSWIPANKQSNMFAIFLAALPVSLMFGGPISGWLLQVSTAFGHFRGWQWLFLLEGLPAVIMGIVIFVWLPRDIGSAKWLDYAEKQILNASLSGERTHKQAHMLAAFLDGRVWMLILILLGVNTGFYGLSFWLPTIIHHAGITDTVTIGLISAIPWVVSIPCMFLNASHSARTGERLWHAALPLVISGITFMVSALTATNFSLSFMFLTIAVGSLMASFPLYWTFPNQILTGTAAAAGLALINSVGALAGILGSFTSSLAQSLTGNINNGTYFFGALALLAGFLYLALPRIFCFENAEAIRVGIGRGATGHHAGVSTSNDIEAQ